MLPPSQPHTSRDYLQIHALVILDARLRSEDALKHGSDPYKVSAVTRIDILLSFFLTLLQSI